MNITQAAQIFYYLKDLSCSLSHHLCYDLKAGDEYTAYTGPFPMSRDLTPQTERDLNCYIEDSQNFIKFIFMGLGRLQAKKKKANYLKKQRLKPFCFC